jgi:TIR domain-containing protein
LPNRAKTKSLSRSRPGPANSPRTQALRDDWQAEERRLLQTLARAQQRASQTLIAQCYSNLGNLAEKQGRIGDAFRHWSRALAVLRLMRFVGTAEYERLLRLLRLWHETPRIWVSYAHRDAKRVRRVLGLLEKHRISVMSDLKFAAGHSIQRQVLDAISICPKGIVFWSKNAKDREWIQYETALLHQLKKQRGKDLKQKALDNTVIFYCLDKDIPPSYFSGDLQIRERRSEQGFAAATSMLVESLKSSEIVTMSPVDGP